jgi:3,4-dihydroxy 2-butanone 4-phosphate synthase/GTP cyclohydrolase II
MSSAHSQIKIAATSSIPTAYGQFKIIVFEVTHDYKEHVALIKGRINHRDDVLTRIHSECLTGDVFGSQRCDCRSQLDLALQRIAEEKRGILIYLRQEGRGIGLTNKIKAYNLQDQGMDTFEANQALGFKDDERNYQLAVAILRVLEIKSVRLLTNNPLKIKELEQAGIKVRQRIPLITAKNEFNRDYIQAKKEKGGHLI